MNPRLKKPQRCRFRSMNRDMSGVSNIVSSIMMLGIVMTIIGMIMTVYVPMWARSKEISHMDDVQDSFEDLKIRIDDQILDNDVGSKSSTGISLGAAGGPIFGIGRSTGQLDFDSGTSTIMVYQTEDAMNIYGEGGGSITYSSRNYYYIDQTYVYENGAVILIQDDVATMMATPNFGITKDAITNNTSLDLNVYSLLGSRHNIAGSDDQVIETVLSSDMDSPHEFDWYIDPSSIGQNITFKFNTFYPDVWRDYYNNTLSAGSNPLILDQDGTGSSFTGDYYIETSTYTGTDPALSGSTDIFVNIRNIMNLDCEHAVIALDIK